MFKVSPYFVEKIWGSDRLKNYGYVLPKNKNIGEAWVVSGYPGNSSVITSGQYNGSFNNITNEWNGLGWSLGIPHPVKGNQAGSSGTTESFITYGGQTPSVIASSFNYDVDNPVNKGIYCFTKTL